MERMKGSNQVAIILSSDIHQFFLDKTYGTGF